MVIAIDFDGTLVRDDDRAFGDVETPFTLQPGAYHALLQLKRAGHTLVLYSARANISIRYRPEADPLVREGVRVVHEQTWEPSRHLAEMRFQAMLEFIELELPGLFDAIDDGRQGKPIADLYIDDRAIQFNPVFGYDWRTIAATWGLPYEVEEHEQVQDHSPHQAVQRAEDGRGDPR